VSSLHIPEYTPHRCTPTQDAYDAAVRALEHYRQTVTELRDLAYRGSGDGAADALETIHQRACRALNEEIR
jgi:hypothetical protein